MTIPFIMINMLQETNTVYCLKDDYITNVFFASINPKTLNHKTYISCKIFLKNKKCQEQVQTSIDKCSEITTQYNKKETN